MNNLWHSFSLRFLWLFPQVNRGLLTPVDESYHRQKRLDIRLMHRYRSYNTSAFFLCFRAFERKEYIFNCYLTHIPFIVRCRFRSRIAHRLDKIKQHTLTSITTAIFVACWLRQHTVWAEFVEIKVRSNDNFVLSVVGEANKLKVRLLSLVSYFIFCYTVCSKYRKCDAFRCFFFVFLG